eukprot:8586439-Ditylum_brightwellii.AAC.1
METEEKLPEVTRTNSSCDSNNKLGVSAEKIFLHPQDGLREDPTPQQSHAWSKNGPAAHVEERTTRGGGCAGQKQKGPTLSKKPVPVKKCKKGKWSRF